MMGGRERESDDEDVEVQRSADCLYSAAGGGRNGDWRGLPVGRDFRGDLYNWRKRYGGLLPSEMKRLKQHEEENSKFGKLVADLSLDKVKLQDVIKRSCDARPAAGGG